MSHLTKFGKVRSPRTHDEARAIVCCVCWLKVKQKQFNPKSGVTKIVSEKLSDLVKKFVYDGYSVQNTSHPTSMCVSCRLTLCSLEKVCLVKLWLHSESNHLYCNI